MKIKTAELTGAALDWAVAKCKGITIIDKRGGVWVPMPKEPHFNEEYSPSTNWSQGGPIIEREISKVFRNVGGTWSAMILKDVPLTPDERGTSLALSRRGQWNGAGSAPLIAAMRCYVASKLGDEVEVPDKLA